MILKVKGKNDATEEDEFAVPSTCECVYVMKKRKRENERSKKL